MKRVKLYMVRDYGETDEYLSTDKDYGESSRHTRDDEVTLETLYELMDHAAEGMNAHDFCGCHKALAALLLKRFDRAVVTEVMRDLLDYEGLQGLGGVCGAGNEKDRKALLKTLGGA